MVVARVKAGDDRRIMEGDLQAFVEGSRPRQEG